jgi:hypothetical protein
MALGRKVPKNRQGRAADDDPKVNGEGHVFIYGGGAKKS